MSVMPCNREHRVLSVLLFIIRTTQIRLMHTLSHSV